MAIEQEKQKVTTIQQRCTWWTSLGGPVCRFGDVVQTCIALVDDYVAGWFTLTKPTSMTSPMPLASSPGAETTETTLSVL